MTRGATTTSHETDQGAVLSFLAGVEPDMRRVDTHASIVFLGKDRVLKVKRAVRLPFLDYSTREKRKQACDEELRVNTLPPRGPDHAGGSGPCRRWQRDAGGMGGRDGEI